MIEHCFTKLLDTASNYVHHNRNEGIDPKTIDITINDHIVSIKYYGYTCDSLECTFGKNIVAILQDIECLFWIDEKIVNYFLLRSTKFTIITQDTNKTLSYIWTHDAKNFEMKQYDDLQCTSTQIIYELDFSKFDDSSLNNGYTSNYINLFWGHAVEVAILNNITVNVNGVSLSDLSRAGSSIHKQ